MAWISGYSYRKKITLTGQAGAGTNYQVKLKIGKAPGAIGEDFDLEGHCLDSMIDIRFTDNDQSTLLDYWIEEVQASGTSYLATVWVKVADDLSSGTVDIYCYYGKADATDGSSGANTFLMYDQFDNIDSWTNVTNGAWVSAADATAKHGSNVAKGTGATGGVYSRALKHNSYQISTTARVRGRIKRNSTATNVFISQRYTDGANFQVGYLQVTNLLYNSGRISSSWDEQSESFTHVADTWYYLEVRESSDNVYVVNASTTPDGAGTSTASNTISDPGASDKVALFVADANGFENYVDWIFVSKYVATEPSYNTVTAEESAPVTFIPKVMIF